MSIVAVIGSAFESLLGTKETIGKWTAPEVPATATVDELTDAIGRLNEELSSKAKLMPRLIHEWRLDSHASAVLRERSQKDSQAIFAAIRELEGRKRALLQAANPVNKYRREHPGASVAEAVEALTSNMVPEINRRILAFAESYLAILSESNGLRATLSVVESELGVCLTNQKGLPLPAWCDLVASPYHRFPAAENHLKAAAAIIANLTTIRPQLEADLKALHDRYLAGEPGHR